MWRKTRQTEASSLITARTKLSYGKKKKKKLKTSAPSLVWERKHCRKHFLSTVYMLLWPHSLRLLRCALAMETGGLYNSTKKNQSDPELSPETLRWRSTFPCIVNSFTPPSTKHLPFQRWKTFSFFSPSTSSIQILENNITRQEAGMFWTGMQVVVFFSLFSFTTETDWAENTATMTD